MKLMITTQNHENYGAHDWDGVGECPQYWKAKGSSEYRYDLGPYGRSQEALTELVMALRGQVEEDNFGWRSRVIDWEVVADDYLTEFERDQLDYEGVIRHPAKTITLGARS